MEATGSNRVGRASLSHKIRYLERCRLFTRLSWSSRKQPEPNFGVLQRRTCRRSMHTKSNAAHRARWYGVIASNDRFRPRSLAASLASISLVVVLTARRICAIARRAIGGCRNWRANGALTPWISCRDRRECISISLVSCFSFESQCCLRVTRLAKRAAVGIASVTRDLRVDQL